MKRSLVLNVFLLNPTCKIYHFYYSWDGIKDNMLFLARLMSTAGENQWMKLISTFVGDKIVSLVTCLKVSLCDSWKRDCSWWEVNGILSEAKSRGTCSCRGRHGCNLAKFPVQLPRGTALRLGLTVFDWICSRRTITLLHSVEPLSLHNPVQFSPGNWSWKNIGPDLSLSPALHRPARET